MILAATIGIIVASLAGGGTITVSLAKLFSKKVKRHTVLTADAILNDIDYDSNLDLLEEIIDRPTYDVHYRRAYRGFTAAVARQVRVEFQIRTRTASAELFVRRNLLERFRQRGMRESHIIAQMERAVLIAFTPSAEEIEIQDLLATQAFRDRNSSLTRLRWSYTEPCWRYPFGKLTVTRPSPSA